MRIKVRDIASSGLMLQMSVMPRDIDLLEDVVNEDAPLEVEGFIKRVDDVVLADLTVVCCVEGHCARCLERISRKVTFKYEGLDFELDPGQEFIDVGARIREELLLDHDPRVLCKEDCLGLCPGCGVDLNYQECECGKKRSNEDGTS